MRKGGGEENPRMSTCMDVDTFQDHMWQHKQEERELKRIEGDVIKNQQAVRRTLRDYEAGESVFKKL